MSHVITFAQPDATLNLNDRMHWAPRSRIVANWRKAAYFAALLHKVPRLGRSLVSVTLPVRDRRKRDPGNWAPTVKPIVDGITDAGVWPDDDSRYVVTQEPSFHVAGDTVTVTITGLP